MGRRGRRHRPPGGLDLRPGFDRRPGDHLRQRRRRHVQPARGGPAGGHALPVHEHVHGLRPGDDPGRDRRGPPDQAGLAVRGVETGRRGPDALLSPRLRAADDGRPPVQHVRAVPALGRGGWGRGHLHAALAGGRAAAHLRGRDPDARPAVRHRLRPVRQSMRCSPMRSSGGSSTRGPGSMSRSTRWPRRSSRTRRASSTSSTSTRRARSRSCAATRPGRGSCWAGRRRSVSARVSGWCAPGWPSGRRSGSSWSDGSRSGAGSRSTAANPSARRCCRTPTR